MANYSALFDTARFDYSYFDTMFSEGTANARIQITQTSTGYGSAWIYIPYKPAIIYTDKVKPEITVENVKPEVTAENVKPTITFDL